MRTFFASHPNVSESDRALIEYLAALDAFASAQNSRDTAYRSPAQLMLNHGVFYRPAPLPDGVPPGELKQRFRNAAHLALDTDLVYVEGYALSLIPVEHAWCVDPATGVVVDPTCRGCR
jgi:hypothetical protein